MISLRTKPLAGVLAGVLVATLAIAATADAAPSKQAQIVVYDDEDVVGTTGLAFGQIRSRNATCHSGRKVKLVAKRAGGRTRILDKGRSSAEGAISGFYDRADVSGADDVNFVAPKIKQHGRTICSKVKEALDEDVPLRGRAQFSTLVLIVDVDGLRRNGAFAGILASNPGGRGCFADRKVKLIADGVLLDRGTTTKHGAWALHLTRAEARQNARFKVGVKRKQLRNGDVCKGDAATSPGIPD